MKILIVSATKSEVEPLIAKMEDAAPKYGGFDIVGKYKGHEIELWFSGVGMVATAFCTTKVMNESHDVAFNVGICGSFNRNLEIGSVVNVYEDTLSELGAEDGDQFLSLEELKLPGWQKFQNKTGAMHPVIESIPKVTGITVNTAHGNEESIKKVYEKYHPFVETMEGAAFMMVCEFNGIPYLQLRAVSNYVEKRNREAWNIPLAVKNLNEKLIEILDCI